MSTDLFTPLDYYIAGEICIITFIVTWSLMSYRSATRNRTITSGIATVHNQHLIMIDQPDTTIKTTCDAPYALSGRTTTDDTIFERSSIEITAPINYPTPKIQFITATIQPGTYRFRNATLPVHLVALCDSTPVRLEISVTPHFRLAQRKTRLTNLVIHCTVAYFLTTIIFVIGSIILS